LNCWSCFK